MSRRWLARVAIALALATMPMGSLGPRGAAPVYHPSRLEVVQPTVTEEGTVLSDPVHQADGDATFEFRVQGTSTSIQANLAKGMRAA